MGKPAVNRPGDLIKERLKVLLPVLWDCSGTTGALLGTSCWWQSMGWSPSAGSPFFQPLQPLCESLGCSSALRGGALVAVGGWRVGKKWHMRNLCLSTGRAVTV